MKVMVKTSKSNSMLNINEKWGLVIHFYTPLNVRYPRVQLAFY